jgi:hypothetical protein
MDAGAGGGATRARSARARPVTRAACQAGPRAGTTPSAQPNATSRLQSGAAWRAARKVTQTRRPVKPTPGHVGSRSLTRVRRRGWCARASGPAGLQRTRRKRTAVRRAAASLVAVRGRATLRAFRRISPWVRKRTKLSISRPAAPRFPPATLHASEVDAPLLSRPTAARFLPHLSVGRAADAPPHGTVSQGLPRRAGNRGPRHRRRARLRPDAASARSTPVGSATSAAAGRQRSRRAMSGRCQPHPFERPAPRAQTSGSAPF